MDERPQLFRQELRRRPTLGEVVPLLIMVALAGVVFAVFTALIMWANQ
jgi:hypothetical protein